MLTFTTLADLAQATGFHTIIWPDGPFGGLPVAWLLPITIDATAVVATDVWLDRDRPKGSPERRYAQRLALVALGLSVGGNAAQHYMETYGVVPPWWSVVLVSAIPPAALGAVVHLAAMIGRTGPDRSDDRPEAAGELADDDVDELVPAAAGDVLELADLADLATGPDVADRPGPTADQPDRRPVGREASNGELVADLREWAVQAGGPIALRRFRAAYGIGTGRATALRDELGWPDGPDRELVAADR